jgi:hypothetical protein
MMNSQQRQKGANAIRTAPDLRSVSTDSTTTVSEPLVNMVLPAPKVGNYIEIDWPGMGRWYKGYVVGINEQKTAIDVMYLDGMLKTEILAEIDYKILPNSTKKNITIKDNANGFTYCISKINATVTKYLTVQTADVENTSKKKRQAPSSSSSAVAAIEEEDTKRFKDAKEEVKYYKKAAAALPKPANPLIFSTTTTTTQPYEPPMTDAEKLRSLAKKLADEKAALAKQKAEIEQRENEIAAQMLEQQRKIDADDFKVIEAKTIEIEKHVKHAFGEISSACAKVIITIEALNDLTESHKSLSPENKKVLLENVQKLFQDSDSNVSLDYTSRTILIKHLDKLNAAITKLQNSLGLAASSSSQPENGAGSAGSIRPTTQANKHKI